MKYSVVVVVVAVVGLLVGTTASAGGIEAGTIEIVPSTSFSYSSYSSGDNDWKITNLQLGGSLGYFFTNLFEAEIGLLVDWTQYDPGSGSSSSVTNTGMVAAFLVNIPTDSKIVPYFGVGGGFLVPGGDVGSSDETTIVAPIVEAGMRFLVGNSASVNLGLSYEYQNNSFGDKDVTANMVSLSVGLSAFVSGGPAD